MEVTDFVYEQRSSFRELILPMFNLLNKPYINRKNVKTVK